MVLKDIINNYLCAGVWTTPPHGEEINFFEEFVLSENKRQKQMRFSLNWDKNWFLDQIDLSYGVYKCHLF